MVVVDDEDYEWISEWKWYAYLDPCTQSFYALHDVVTGQKSPRLRHLTMHQAIWERHNGSKAKGCQIDHADLNTLNNILSNLRPATRSQQMQNQRLKSSNTSGYRGVSLRASGKWVAQITVDKKRIFLGYFTHKIEHAHAYDVAALTHHDPAFAQLNFPRAMILVSDSLLP